MGAYWHLALPVAVRFQDTKDMVEVFENLYGADFIFDSIEQYQIESPPFSDGSRLTFDRSEKIYRMDSNLWKAEFRNFYLTLLEHFQVCATQRKYAIYSVALDRKLLDPFLQAFEMVDVQDDPEKYLETLQAIEGNYFLHFYDLPQSVAYHGYPLPRHHHSSIKMISLLSSHEKMDVIPEETVMFHNALDALKERLQPAYRLAKYLFVVGF